MDRGGKQHGAASSSIVNATLWTVEWLRVSVGQGLVKTTGPNNGRWELKGSRQSAGAGSESESETPDAATGFRHA